jgi:hypothetical protein
MTTLHIDGLRKLERIITPEQRRTHIAQLTGFSSPEGIELVGDLAAVNGSLRHDPATGFNQWLADTPEWIKDIALRRGWASEGTPLEGSDQ